MSFNDSEISNKIFCYFYEEICAILNQSNLSIKALTLWALSNMVDEENFVKD